MNAERAERGWVQVYFNIPIVTRLYTSTLVLITLATNFDIISQYDLYLNPHLILKRYQVWRLLTPFLFAGPISLGTAFNLLFTYRYSRILEENSFHQKTSDYCFMFIFMKSLMLIVAGTMTNLIFLEQAFTHALLYVWCRRNPLQRVIVLGFLTFRAHHVPFVLVGLSLLTGSQVEVDAVAIGVGHMYYFLEDVFPNQRGGFRILKTPKILQSLLDHQPEEVNTPDDDTPEEPNEEPRAENNNIPLVEERVAPDALLMEEDQIRLPL